MTVSVAAQRERMSMYNRNTLKLGLFGANCSSGRAATKVPERWSGSWEDNLRLAQLADAAGIDFILPIGRWKGYGGETNFENATFETINWATGLLAQTQRIHVFGTVHTPLLHPVYAAKAMVTADQTGRGRFGLNVVCGWNQDEFAMFGQKRLADDQRYVHGAEWVEIIKQLWEREGEFDFDGEFFALKGLWAQPKPYGGTRPIIMNAGSSPNGHAFATAHADCIFTGLRSLEEGAKTVAERQAAARAIGRDVGIFTPGYIVCRRTHAEAEEYHQYYAEENGDWEAVDHLMKVGGGRALDPEVFRRLRIRFAGGHGGYPLIGTPDEIAQELANISAVGYAGYCFSFVNYLDEFPYFRDEVLPRLERMGLREPLH